MRQIHGDHAKYRIKQYGDFIGKPQVKLWEISKNFADFKIELAKAVEGLVSIQTDFAEFKTLAPDPVAFEEDANSIVKFGKLIADAYVAAVLQKHGPLAQFTKKNEDYDTIETMLTQWRAWFTDAPESGKHPCVALFVVHVIGCKEVGAMKDQHPLLPPSIFCYFLHILSRPRTARRRSFKWPWGPFDFGNSRGP